MLCFTVHLVLDATTVCVPQGRTQRPFLGALWRVVIQHAPELGRKAVSP